MSNITNRLVDALQREIDTLTAEVMQLAAGARFRRVRDGDSLVTLLEARADGKAKAAELFRRLEDCGVTLVSVMKRRRSGRDADVRSLIDDFRTFVMLEHTDDFHITEMRWREAFAHDCEVVALEFKRLIESQRETVTETEPAMEHEPFHLLVTQVDDSQWRVSATARVGSAETIVAALPSALFEKELAEHSGKRLFTSVFTGSIAELFRHARAAALGHGRGMRVEIDGKSVAVPWEALHDGKQFLGVAAVCPIVRHVSTTQPNPPGVPLRILLTISAPRDLTPLNTESERGMIEEALRPLVFLGLVRLDVARDGTLNTTRRMLRSAASEGRPYHVWHFIGHGKQGLSGELFMAGTDGKPHPVSGPELDAVLSDHREVTLLVLNACEGAKGGAQSLAAKLAAAGTRAVIAMQFKIADTAAIVFAEELYGSIADGASLETAVTEARRALFCQPSNREWFTPVLFSGYPSP